MLELTWTLAIEVAVAVLLLLLYRLRRPRRHHEMGEKFLGPPALPFIGNAHQLGKNPHELYNVLEATTKKFKGNPFRLWFGNSLFIFLTKPKDVEIILGSNKLIDKGYSYTFLEPWLGLGLLTSTGSKWHRNRKILTPAFHFKILEEFVEVFHHNGKLLTDCFQPKVGGPAIDLLHYISLNTLDNICETAMGLTINAIKDAESEYVKAVKWQSDTIITRSFKPWLQNELIFFLSGKRQHHLRTLEILHGTTNSVIKCRREALLKRRAANGSATGSAAVAEDGTKRRLAFLDLLIESALDGSGLTDENIREEVDTFMFEGHDTTAAAITFTLWMLSWHQDIQKAAVEEILDVWPDAKEPLTYQNLQDMKLMERILKEVMRLYPSVPFYSRKVAQDVQLSGGQIIPEGADVSILTFMVHKDPEIFPDPEKFDPDRFLPENIKNRHPYAYTPFSAGPRNCIGQKFAMLEMKCTLAHLLRQFRFTPGAPSPKLKLFPELILTAKKGVVVEIHLRS